MSSATGQCPKCFTANSYDTVVCSACGARLPWASTAPVTQPLPQAPLSPTVSLAPPEKMSRNNAVVWVLGCLGAVILIPAIVAFLALTLLGNKVNTVYNRAESPAPAPTYAPYQ